MPAKKNGTAIAWFLLATSTKLAVFPPLCRSHAFKIVEIQLTARATKLEEFSYFSNVDPARSSEFKAEIRQLADYKWMFEQIYWAPFEQFEALKNPQLKAHINILFVRFVLDSEIFWFKQLDQFGLAKACEGKGSKGIWALLVEGSLSTLYFVANPKFDAEFNIGLARRILFKTSEHWYALLFSIEDRVFHCETRKDANCFLVEEKGAEGVAKRIYIDHTTISPVVLHFSTTANHFIENVIKCCNTDRFPALNHTSLGMILLVRDCSRIEHILELGCNEHVVSGDISTGVDYQHRPQLYLQFAEGSSSKQKKLSSSRRKPQMLTFNFHLEDKVKLQGEGNIRTTFDSLGKYMKREKILFDGRTLTCYFEERT